LAVMPQRNINTLKLTIYKISTAFQKLLYTVEGAAQMK